MVLGLSVGEFWVTNSSTLYDKSPYVFDYSQVIFLFLFLDTGKFQVDFLICSHTDFLR